MGGYLPGCDPGRPDDTFGVGLGYARISSSARALEVDTALFSGPFHRVRQNESLIEVTYQYQAAPWWIVQPDFEYILNPGGGIANPSNPGRRVGDAAVLGLRTSITF